MCDEAPLTRSLRPSDAAPASPAHAERSGAFLTPARAHAPRAAASYALRFAFSQRVLTRVRISRAAPRVSQTRCRC
jgi:hypothetical protein